MAKKKQEPIHKLTLDEYDVLTMDNQCAGALKERNDIILKLREVSSQMLTYKGWSNNTAFIEEMANAANGLIMACRIIDAMPHYEDRCGCSECGSI